MSLSAGAPGVAEGRLWLLHHGITESPSPAMHSAALAAMGLPGWRYTACDVEPAALPAALARMREGAARGANVTMPHKLPAAAACDRLDGDAAVIGSANTLIVEDGRLVGDNTDAAGFACALRTQGLWPGRDVEAVVLGAGGAARAVVLALSRVPVRRVSVVARRREAASEIAGVFGGRLDVRALRWEEAQAGGWLARVGLVVNATPAGAGALPFQLRDLPAAAAVVDLGYRPRPVELVSVARALGHRAEDGTEMLLQQGMLSLRRWTGREPALDAARAALERALGLRR